MVAMQPNGTYGVTCECGYLVDAANVAAAHEKAKKHDEIRHGALAATLTATDGNGTRFSRLTTDQQDGVMLMIATCANIMWDDDAPDERLAYEHIRSVMDALSGWVIDEARFASSRSGETVGAQGGPGSLTRTKTMSYADLEIEKLRKKQSQGRLR